MIATDLQYNYWLSLQPKTTTLGARCSTDQGLLRSKLLVAAQ